MLKLDTTIGVIVSARFSSNRLPGKALLPIGGHSLLGLLLHRLKNSRYNSKLIVATSVKKEDNSIVAEAEKYGAEVYRGSLDDVVERYYNAASFFKIDIIVRLTGDNPFVSSEFIDSLLEQCILPMSVIYTTRPKCPKGLNVDIFSMDTLEYLNSLQSLSKDHREHVTSWFFTKENNFKKIELEIPNSISQTKNTFSIDTLDDYKLAVERLKGFDGVNFSTEEFVKSLK